MTPIISYLVVAGIFAIVSFASLEHIPDFPNDGIVFRVVTALVSSILWPLILAYIVLASLAHILFARSR